MPTGATDHENSVRQLFVKVGKNVVPDHDAPGIPVTDERCQVTRVNVVTSVDRPFAEQSTAAPVFSSMMLQGRFLSVSGNSPVPIHVASSQRAPVRLGDSYLNTATICTDSAQALWQMLIQANTDANFQQSIIMFDVKPAAWPARVEIELNDGQVLRAGSDVPRGNMENPVSTEALEAKFRGLVEPRLGKAIRDGAIDLVRTLEDVSDTATGCRELNQWCLDFLELGGQA